MTLRQLIDKLEELDAKRVKFERLGVSCRDIVLEDQDGKWFEIKKVDLHGTDEDELTPFIDIEKIVL